jgi:threonine dehydratase
MEDLPDADAVVVPVGGGGLISGIATAVKALAPSVQIFGVEAAAAPGAYLSFKDGYCHETVEIKPSVADGLMGTLTPLTFEISHPLVESIQVVAETEIIQAMKVLQQDEQLMVEGSAAVGIAALLSGELQLHGKRVVVVLTGRNINAGQFNKLMAS